MKNAAKTFGVVVAVLGLMIDGSGESRAEMVNMVLTFNAATTINGDTASGNMSATIADTSENTVRITLINGLTAPNEFATTWGFGINSDLFNDYANISFTKVSTSPNASSPAGTVGPSFADTVIASASTGFNPSSIGDFNLRFDWDSNNHSFTAGTTVVYDLKYSGSQAFYAELFNATSHGEKAEKKGFVYTAVKIQGIQVGSGSNSKGSGELGAPDQPTITAVPEPSTIAMVSAAIPMGLGLAWRRRRKAMAA